MCPGSSLNVILWVPIAIINDNHFGSCQIDTLATSLGGQQEHIPRFLGVIESIDGVLSVSGLDLPIDLLELDHPGLQVLLDQHQHQGKLRKYQNLLALLLELDQELLQQDHLPTALYQ